MCRRRHGTLEQKQGEEERGKTHHILDLLVRKNPDSLSLSMLSDSSKKVVLLRAIKI